MLGVLLEAIAALQPIPGKVIDPEPKEVPDAVKKLDERDDAAGAAVGVGYRTMQRFSSANAGLLAAGTTYYLFLAMFSIVAFGYGLIAILGADSLTEHITNALSEAFPGLIGDDGIDPERLRSVGRSVSILGLIALLWSGGGAMVAASGSFHKIYGARPDPRNFLKARLRLLGWMLILLPLVGASYAASSVVVNFADDVLDALGLEGSGGKWLLTIVGLLVGFAIDFLIVFLMLGNLGGIRPPQRPRLIGAVVGAAVIGILKFLMAWIIGLAVDKPEYGALAAPIAILLVLYLQCMAVYGAAALTAGIAERDVPLEELAAG